jgi:hypothetical protein
MIQNSALLRLVASDATGGSCLSLNGGWKPGSRYRSLNAKGSIPWLFWWPGRFGGREINVFMTESRFSRWLWRRRSLRKLEGGPELVSSELAPLVVLDCDFLFLLPLGLVRFVCCYCSVNCCTQTLFFNKNVLSSLKNGAFCGFNIQCRYACTKKRCSMHIVSLRENPTLPCVKMFAVCI